MEIIRIEFANYGKTHTKIIFTLTFILKESFQTAKKDSCRCFFVKGNRRTKEVFLEGVVQLSFITTSLFGESFMLP